MLLFLIAACTDRLDVEPAQSISSNVALSTDQGVKTAVRGAYDLLSDNDIWGGGQFLSELFADANDQVWTGTFLSISEIFSKSILKQNGPVEQFWTESYKTINQTNNILVNLEVVHPNDQMQIAAEARFIRGVIYFELINLFAKTYIDGNPTTNLGVPIVIMPTTEINESLKVTRNSVVEVYDFILADLLFAKANLPANNDAFATTYAASGILSRVYLMQEKFDLAGIEADRVIASDLFTLVSNFENAFTQSSNTPEDIFTIEITSQDGRNAFIQFYAGANAGGRGDIAIQDSHVAKYEVGDQRADFFYLDDIGVRRTSKWRDNPNKDGNINIIRLAEMYLTRAESRFRLGDIDGATSDINVIRERAGVASLTNNDLSLETILQERSLELAFEGHLYRDTKRNRKNIGAIPFDDDRMIYPIPQRELDVNANLIQNSGY